MEMVESRVGVEDEDEDACVSIPVGGPIYVPNLVTPLTRVADFKTSVRQHLQDGEEASNSLQFSEEHSNAGRTDNCRISSNKRVCLKCSGRGRNLSASFESLNGSPSESGCNGQNSSRKRKRRVRNNRAVENSYIAKVEQLAKIKQKQDEDKAAARKLIQWHLYLL